MHPNPQNNPEINMQHIQQFGQPNQFPPNPIFNQNQSPPYQNFGQPIFQENIHFPPQLPPLHPVFKLPQESTHSLYIDGIPNDTTEREVSHVFRPYPGFQRVRLIKKQTQKGREYYLCFVDFDNSTQASIAMQTLQGYRFDKNDKQGLKISYANNPKDNLKEKQKK